MISPWLRREAGLRTLEQDEETLKAITTFLAGRELTFDRASRILEDARKMLPYLAQLSPNSSGKDEELKKMNSFSNDYAASAKSNALTSDSY
ncbi:MAG: hypothetical protein K1W34_13945 [Lachnospiraceae bacterium]